VAAIHRVVGYRQWSLTAELDCLKADQNGGDLPADDAARDRATAMRWTTSKRRPPMRE
jgi:hypothetical protein